MDSVNSRSGTAAPRFNVYHMISATSCLIYFSLSFLPPLPLLPIICTMALHYTLPSINPPYEPPPPPGASSSTPQPPLPSVLLPSYLPPSGLRHSILILIPPFTPPLTPPFSPGRKRHPYPFIRCAHIHTPSSPGRSAYTPGIRLPYTWFRMASRIARVPFT